LRVKQTLRYLSRFALPVAIILAVIAGYALPVLAIQSGMAAYPEKYLAALANTPWPMFQHDQRHTGLSPYLAAQDNTTRWAYGTSSLIRGSAAIGSDGTIYVNSYDYNCKLYAFNPDGIVKWAKNTDSVDGAPAIGSDGTIYIAGIYGLYAYTPDGTRKWFCSALDLNGSPVIGNDGTIYCGQSGSGGAGLLYAFRDNGSSGSVKWTYGTGQLLHTAPAIGNGGTIYIGSVYDTLFALTDNTTNAILKWSFLASGSLRSSPPSIGGDGTIYIGSDYGYVYAITDNVTNAVQKWRFDTEGTVESTPAIGTDGTIYVGCEYGPYILFALNPAGNPRWSYGSGDIASSSPVIGNDGTIYIGDVYDKVYAVFDDKVHNTAVLKWEYTAGDAIYGSAAIGSDGTVYIGSYDGKFYAFNNRPLVTSVNPNSGKQGQTLNNVIITGTNFTGATAVSFGAGITTNSYTVSSATQLTATITIAAGAATGLRDVSVTTHDGTGTRIGGFTVVAAPLAPLAPTQPTSLISTSPSHSSSGGGVPTVPQGPAPISNITVENISLSSAKVGPGAPVTVTANVVNKGTADGSSRIKLYVNGQEEAHQGVTLSSGSSTPVKFIVSRDEPGTYSVYVGSIAAGSFEVDQFTDPNLILYISAALILSALIFGIFYIRRKRPSGY